MNLIRFFTFKDKRPIHKKETIKDGFIWLFVGIVLLVIPQIILNCTRICRKENDYGLMHAKDEASDNSN